jgi:branched-chain amino acid transport system substrate-binding protein
MMTSPILRIVAVLALAMSVFYARPGIAAETIKIAYVDPFSGPFASGGDEFLKIFKVLFDRVNVRGGALGRQFEVVPFDDKLQPSEALIALQTITDQNIPFIMQCTGSNVGAALS